jgi:hypothetical protein
LIDTKYYTVFWKLELSQDFIIELRPEADFCIFRSNKHGWSAISLLKSRSTGGIKSTTMTNYERKEMDDEDICIVDRFKRNPGGRFSMVKLDTR